MEDGVKKRANRAGERAGERHENIAGAKKGLEETQQRSTLENSHENKSRD